MRPDQALGQIVDMDEPRRPEKSGYHLFAAELRPSLDKKPFCMPLMLIDARGVGRVLRTAETQKEIAEKWQMLSDDEKAAWNQRLELKRAEVSPPLVRCVTGSMKRGETAG